MTKNTLNSQTFTLEKDTLKNAPMSYEVSLPQNSQGENNEDFPQEINRYSSKSCVAAFMSQIGHHRLLSKEEEEKLGKTIQKGKAKDKEEALNCLVLHNLKLAVAIATEYQNRGLELEDLISEATIGLTKAAKRFKPEYKSKFSTYAYHWIKQSILRSIHKKARMVRLPTHLLEKISKLRKVQESISRNLGRDASSQELCSQTGNKAEVIERLLNVQSQTSHIDQSSSYNPEDESDILKTIADSNQPSPLEIFTKKNEWATVCEVLEQLPQREQTILKLRFGIGTDKPKTLEEVGKITKLSRERVRQIENKTLKDLKEKMQKLDGKKSTAFIKKRI
jgi:RNA polymerase primary sigma factor